MDTAKYGRMAALRLCYVTPLRLFYDAPAPRAQRDEAERDARARRLHAVYAFAARHCARYVRYIDDEYMNEPSRHAAALRA